MTAEGNGPPTHELRNEVEEVSSLKRKKQIAFPTLVFYTVF